jgi:tRNA G10  N-methylase Trm11
MILLFELGRNHELSRAEIEQVFLSQKISYTVHEQDKEKLFLETKKEVDISKIMSLLGGTIKIAEQVSEKTSLESIVEYLNTAQNDGKIQFSLSGNNAKKLALEAKKQLKADDRSVRYIEANNTATILHNNLVEKQGDLSITKHGLFVTRAIQAIEEWGERDFGRPGRDDRSGMLPPKLARIMINLTGSENTATLLDPFCGSGTILTEALSLGFENLVGNDTSEKALEDSKTNITWMNEQLKKEKTIKARLILGDAASLHGATGKNSIQAIATEPYMGKPLRGGEDKKTLTKQALELGVLYIAAFKSFEKIMTPGSPIVFIIPRFRCKDEWVRINILDQIQHLGFSLERLAENEHFILYHRPEQFVGREIWKFRKI